LAEREIQARGWIEQLVDLPARYAGSASERQAAEGIGRLRSGDVPPLWTHGAIATAANESLVETHFAGPPFWCSWTRQGELMTP
jgi:hypothetical protein